MGDLKTMREAADEMQDFVVVQMTPAKYRALIACAEALGPMIDRWEPDGDADKRMWDRAVAALAQLEAAP